MEPIDRVKGILDGIPELKGKIYLYDYSLSQAAPIPIAILNYTGLNEANAIRGSIRLAMVVSVQLLVSRKEQVSKLLRDAIKACAADPYVIEITGSATTPTTQEFRRQGALRHSVFADFSVTVRE